MADDPKSIEETLAELQAEIAELKAGKAAPPDDDPDPSDPAQTDTLSVDAAVKAGITSDRKRCSELEALYEKSGISDTAMLRKWKDNEYSVKDAKCELADLVIKQNKLVADDAGDEDLASEVALAKEYEQHAKIHASLGVTREEYIESRKAG